MLKNAIAVLKLKQPGVNVASIASSPLHFTLSVFDQFLLANQNSGKDKNDNLKPPYIKKK